jgi:hypothetical protein
MKTLRPFILLIPLISFAKFVPLDTSLEDAQQELKKYESVIVSRIEVLTDEQLVPDLLGLHGTAQLPHVGALLHAAPECIEGFLDTISKPHIRFVLAVNFVHLAARESRLIMEQGLRSKYNIVAETIADPLNSFNISNDE